MDNISRLGVFPNQKPWMTKVVWRLVRKQNGAFRNGDMIVSSVTRTYLKRGIKEAKLAYERKI